MSLIDLFAPPVPRPTLKARVVSDEPKLRRRNSMRAWQLENAERVREKKRERAKQEAAKKRAAKWYRTEQGNARRKQKSREWYLRNREKVLQKLRERRATPEYQQKRRAYMDKYRRTPEAKALAAQAARRYYAKPESREKERERRRKLREKQRDQRLQAQGQ